MPTAAEWSQATDQAIYDNIRSLNSASEKSWEELADIVKGLIMSERLKKLTTGKVPSQKTFNLLTLLCQCPLLATATIKNSKEIYGLFPKELPSGLFDECALEMTSEQENFFHSAVKNKLEVFLSCVLTMVQSETIKDGINQENYLGNTPLHYAVLEAESKKNMAEIILKNGGDFNISNNEGYSSLNYALLKKTYSNSTDDFYKKNASLFLDSTSASQKIFLVHMIGECSPNSQESKYKLNDIKTALKHGTDVNTLVADIPGGESKPPLLYLAGCYRDDRVEIAKSIILQGGDLTYVSKKGNTIFSQATLTQTSSCLLNTFFSYLMALEEKGFIDSTKVNELIQKSDDEQKTLFHCAAKNPTLNCELLKLLRNVFERRAQENKMGVNLKSFINQKNKSGLTALAVYLSRDINAWSLDIVNEFIDLGADLKECVITLQGSDGPRAITYFEYALHRKECEVARIFAEKNLSVAQKVWSRVKNEYKNIPKELLQVLEKDCEIKKTQAMEEGNFREINRIQGLERLVERQEGIIKKQKKMIDTQSKRNDLLEKNHDRIIKEREELKAEVAKLKEQHQETTVGEKSPGSNNKDLIALLSSNSKRNHSLSKEVTDLKQELALLRGTNQKLGEELQKTRLEVARQEGKIAVLEKQPSKETRKQPAKKRKEREEKELRSSSVVGRGDNDSQKRRVIAGSPIPPPNTGSTQPSFFPPFSFSNNFPAPPPRIEGSPKNIFPLRNAFFNLSNNNSNSNSSRSNTSSPTLSSIIAEPMNGLAQPTAPALNDILSGINSCLMPILRALDTFPPALEATEYYIQKSSVDYWFFKVRVNDEKKAIIDEKFLNALSCLVNYFINNKSLNENAQQVVNKIAVFVSQSRPFESGFCNSIPIHQK